LLHNAAQFKAVTAPFDQQIMGIKDKTWPNPPKQVWDQLRALQIQKESAINSFTASLVSRLGREVAPKISAHLLRVKTRVKGYADVPVIPGQRPKTALYQKPTPSNGRLNALLGIMPSHSFLERNAMAAATIAQMGDGTVYLYSDIDTDSNGAYGYGSVSASGDSYGHTYTVRTEVNGPSSCQYSVGVNSAFVSLVGCNGLYYDGFYSSTAIAEQYCPIANATNDVGSSNSSETVAPFVKLVAFTSVRRCEKIN